MQRKDTAGPYRTQDPSPEMWGASGNQTPSEEYAVTRVCADNVASSLSSILFATLDVYQPSGFFATGCIWASKLCFCSHWLECLMLLSSGSRERDGAQGRAALKLCTETELKTNGTKYLYWISSVVLTNRFNDIQVCKSEMLQCALFQGLNSTPNQFCRS